jgi:hypothetical protein
MGCNTGCNTGCGCGSHWGGLWSGHGGGCGAGCGTDCCGGGFLQGCRDFLSRLCSHNDCCNTGCSTCGSGTVIAPVAPKGETIPPPAGGKDKAPAQPMPKAAAGEPPQVQIIDPLSPGSIQTPNLDVPPPPPAIGPAGLTPGRPF